jgi:GT2 family glycosyltransferase
MCLKSLENQTHQTDVDISFEIGTAQARNRCIKRNLDKYDVFAFIDDDAIADERWIEEIEKALLDRTSIVGGLILPKYAVSPPFWFSASLHPFIAINPVSRHIYSCNMAVKREVFEAGYFFREDLGRTIKDLGSGEETSLLRAAQARFKISFCERAKVFHLISKEKLSAQYIFKRFYWEAKSLTREHGRKKTFRGKLMQLIKNPQQIRFLPFHIGYFGGILSG